MDTEARGGLPADDYELLDSGGGRKLERFGPYRLARPAAQAVWQPRDAAAWERASASFDREDGHRWEGRERLPEAWPAVIGGIRFRLSSTDFGHLGVFPEPRAQWAGLRGVCRRAAGRGAAPAVLNLFAYSGGSTLAAAGGGAEVCHLDASRGMVDWARGNAALNGLEEAPVRWIVDDAIKFLQREVRRGRRYDGIVLDPPTFGRGKAGEVFKIETHLPLVLDLCRRLLAEQPVLFHLSCHTPGYTPVTLHHLVRQTLGVAAGSVTCGEMLLTGAPDVPPLPSGAFARWAAGEG